MKRIKKYGDFMTERNSADAINEEILGWLKDKISSLKMKLDKLKGNALRNSLLAILPKEILSVIKAKAGLNESASLLMEGVDEDISDLVSKLDPSQFKELYSNLEMSGISIDDKEDWLASAQKLLGEKGVSVDKETLASNKGNIKDIYSVVDRYAEKNKLGDIAKKALKALSFILFFLILSAKLSMAVGAGQKTDFAKVKKSTQMEQSVKIDGGDDDDDGDRITKVTKSKSAMESLVKKGWTLDSTQVDTVYSKLIENAPTSDSTNVTLDLPSGDAFSTGKWDLKQDVANGIIGQVDKILQDEGLILSIKIESSTDTEPIEIGNEKLAENRAESVKAVLVGMGVDESIITIVPKADSGPNVYSKTMSEDEREAARNETAKYRYVKVDIAAVDDVNSVLPDISDSGIEKVITKYYLSKAKDGGESSVKKISGSSLKVTKNKGAINKLKKYSVGDKCYFTF